MPSVSCPPQSSPPSIYTDLVIVFESGYETFWVDLEEVRLLRRRQSSIISGPGADANGLRKRREFTFLYGFTSLYW